jgi:hypothetical protein
VIRAIDRAIAKLKLTNARSTVGPRLVPSIRSLGRVRREYHVTTESHFRSLTSQSLDEFLQYSYKALIAEKASLVTPGFLASFEYPLIMVIVIIAGPPQFGDGIMSAIDFRTSVARKSDPKGDRVVITLDGKVSGTAAFLCFLFRGLPHTVDFDLRTEPRLTRSMLVFALLNTVLALLVHC